MGKEVRALRHVGTINEEQFRNNVKEFLATQERFDQFAKKVFRSDIPVVLKFDKKNNKAMEGIENKIKSEFENEFELEELDVDNEPVIFEILKEKFNIKKRFLRASFPVYLFLYRTKELFRNVGKMTEKDFRNKVKKMLEEKDRVDKDDQAE